MECRNIDSTKTQEQQKRRAVGQAEQYKSNERKKKVNKNLDSSAVCQWCCICSIWRHRSVEKLAVLSARSAPSLCWLHRYTIKPYIYTAGTWTYSVLLSTSFSNTPFPLCSAHRYTPSLGVRSAPRGGDREGAWLDAYRRKSVPEAPHVYCIRSTRSGAGLYICIKKKSQCHSKRRLIVGFQFRLAEVWCSLLVMPQARGMLVGVLLFLSPLLHFWKEKKKSEKKIPGNFSLGC